MDYEDLAILVPVARDLIGIGCEPGIILCRFAFDGPTAWKLPGEEWFIAPFLSLLRSEQSAIGQTGAHVLQMDDTVNVRLQHLANRVEEVGESRIVRRFFDGSAGGVDVVHVAEVAFEGVHARTLWADVDGSGLVVEYSHVGIASPLWT